MAGALDESARLVAEAERAGLTLRMLGSVGVWHHCERADELYAALAREPPGDVDLAADARAQGAVAELLAGAGLVEDPSLRHSQEFGIRRLIYWRPDASLKVEVFLDVLRMSHTIELRDRLALDSPTVPVAYLLLSKLQVHEVTEKDLKDTLVLLAEHPLGGGERETVDVPYVLGLVRDDWGLYTTAQKNLALAERLDADSSGLDDETRAVVLGRIAELRSRMEDEPKTRRFRMRARVGTRVKWYEDVGEVDR